MTLVLTHPFDPTADYVVTELNRRGAPVFRCDPGEFPLRLSISARLDGETWTGSLELPERDLALAEVGCVYYRRPTVFDLPKDTSEQVRRWSLAEARMGLGGVLSTLPRWLNHPADISRAEYKPVQLAQARRCGLRVPATLVTNDPAEAARFVTDVGSAIYKPFTPAAINDRDEQRVLFATHVTVADLDESIRRTAHLFQARVDREYDVRLTVVDDSFLAARIDATDSQAELDWRANYDALTYAPIPEVPPAVRDGIRALMGSLGLRFGAIDFVVDPDGRWWFLEINPNGQWAWIEDATGLRIAAAIADALTREVP